MQFQLFGTGLDFKKACIFFVLGFASIAYVAALPLPGQDADSTSTSFTSSSTNSELVRRAYWTARVRYHDESTMPGAMSYLVNDIRSKITGVIQASTPFPVSIEFPMFKLGVPNWNANNQIPFDYILIPPNPSSTLGSDSRGAIHQTLSGSGVVCKVEVGPSFKIEAKMNPPPV